MAAIGSLVIHEPSAVMTSHLWECVLVKDFDRVGSSCRCKLERTVIARQEAASMSVCEC